MEIIQLSLLQNARTKTIPVIHTKCRQYAAESVGFKATKGRFLNEELYTAK